MTDDPLMPASIRTPRFHSWASHGSGSRTNLPFPLTSFVGRTSQVAEVTRLASTTRLLTLTGPGGVGKTRLALEVAGQLLPQFADGIWMVDLAPLSQASDVPQAVALALHVRQEAKRPMLTTLVDALQEREMLVLLDNCEHLITACLEVIAALLRACPAISILATSREALGVGGELLWRVPSLSVPPSSFEKPAQGGSESVTEQVRSYEAVQLFLTRAQAVRPDFHLTPTNAAAIAQICQRLDGIPLAIELAAARVQVLSTEQIAARLADRFGLLTGGNRLALPRQQTLRATLDWSYGLLSKQEQMLLQRLAVFAGAFSLEAAEAVCSREDSGTLEMLDGLTQLVNKSLVVTEEQEEQARYRLLETVRQYALEKLEGTGEAVWLEKRHLDYFLRFVQEAAPQLGGRQQVVWVRRVEHAYDNLRAAFARGLSRALWEPALYLAAGLWLFWEVLGREAEGYEWLERALRAPAQGGVPAARAQALLAYGSLAAHHGDFPLAQSFLEESLAVFRELDNQQGIALTLNALGRAALGKRNLDQANTSLEEAVVLLEQMSDQSSLARTRANLALVAFEQGDYQLARLRMERNVAETRVLGEPWLLGSVLTHLGELTRFEGKYAQAARLYEEALRCFQEVGNANLVAMSLSNLVEVERVQGDLVRALGLGLEAVQIWQRFLGRKEHLYAGLVGLGGCVLALYETELAARLYGAAEIFSEQQHVHQTRTDLALYERDLTIFWSQGEKEHLQVAWEEGRTLSLAQAVALVEAFYQAIQAARPAAVTASTSSPSLAFSKYPADLTAREMEVLRLVAQGWTNKQIAQQLVISPKTVNRHLESLFRKLGVTSRSAATRFAVAHQLA